jgi:hypothetical protein
MSVKIKKEKPMIFKESFVGKIEGEEYTGMRTSAEKVGWKVSPITKEEVREINTSAVVDELSTEERMKMIEEMPGNLSEEVIQKYHMLQDRLKHERMTYRPSWVEYGNPYTTSCVVDTMGEPVKFADPVGFTSPKDELHNRLDDYLRTSKKTAYKFKRHSEDEEPMEPEFEGDTKSSGEEFRERIKNLREGYKDNLIKFLFKSSIINTTHNCFSFDPIGIIPAKLAANVNIRVTRDLDQINYDTAGIHNINLTPIEKSELSTFLSECYLNGSTNIIYSLYIDTKDVYKDIVEMCINKGVKLDKEFKELVTTDFKDLRSKGSIVKCIYLSMLNEVIVIDNCLQTFHGSNNQGFLDHLKTLPDVELEKSVEELININGMGYSKSIFESSVECSLEDFIYNLEIEQYMSLSDNVKLKEEVKLL